MLLMVSPAKKLIVPEINKTDLSVPVLLDDARALGDVAKKLSRPRIKAMMKLSENLTDLTYQRFQALDLADENRGSAALLTFAGDVYRGFDANTLSADDLAFAQDHVRILSGLYGVLRPLDAMQPYRLDMGRKIKTTRGEDLYDYWGPRIAEELNKLMDASDEPRVLINLASHEYFKSVDQDALKSRVISPVFKEEKNGQQRILSMFAKVARGLMARWIVENRITAPARLHGFSVGGYRYQQEGSSADRPLFVRPQPAKKAA